MSTSRQELIVIGKMSMQLTIRITQLKFGLCLVQTMGKRTFGMHLNQLKHENSATVWRISLQIIG
jgi:hypothetical protein